MSQRVAISQEKSSKISAYSYDSGAFQNAAVDNKASRSAHVCIALSETANNIKLNNLSKCDLKRLKCKNSDDMESKTKIRKIICLSSSRVWLFCLKT